MVAAMRKPILVLNAVLQDQVSWQLRPVTIPSNASTQLLDSYISTLYLGLKGLDVTLTLVMRSTL